MYHRRVKIADVVILGIVCSFLGLCSCASTKQMRTETMVPTNVHSSVASSKESRGGLATKTSALEKGKRVAWMRTRAKRAMHRNARTRGSQRQRRFANTRVRKMRSHRKRRVKRKRRRRVRRFRRR